MSTAMIFQIRSRIYFAAINHSIPATPGITLILNHQYLTCSFRRFITFTDYNQC